MKGEKNTNYERVEYICDGCGKNILVIPSIIKNQKHIFCSNDCYKKNIGKYYSGKNSSNWNHKLTQEEREETRRYPDYYNWRNDVYSRDNYTCQKCGSSKSGTLVAHHIYNYSEHKELRTKLSNGITLCVDCHREYHNIYGYKNNNETQLNYFLNNQKAI